MEAAGWDGDDDIFCLMSSSTACSVAMFCAICSCLAASCSTLRRTTSRLDAKGASCCAGPTSDSSIVSARLKRLASRRPLDGVVTRDALDAADLPLIAPIDRMRLPVGERGLGEHAGLHGHLVLHDDFLAADRLRDAAKRVAHQGDDGDLHVGLFSYCPFVCADFV